MGLFFFGLVLCFLALVHKKLRSERGGGGLVFFFFAPFTIDLGSGCARGLLLLCFALGGLGGLLAGWVGGSSAAFFLLFFFFFLFATAFIL
jgi:hypothetical protein